MPSHRRELDAGGPALQLHAAAFFPNYLLSCTPQAHCRSDSLNSYPFASLVDMDSWLTASGLETTRNCGSPTALNNYQQLAEKPMGSVDNSTGISTGIAFPQMGDYQSDAWWPSVNAQIFSRDLSTQNGISTTKPGAGNSMTFTTNNYTVDSSWCHTIANTVTTVANADMCDLNTPGEPPSAIPVASVAPSMTIVAAGATSTRPTKVSRKGGQSKVGAVSAPTSPSELRPIKEKSLGVQKKWNGKRPVSQRENHIWSERQRRKGMNYLFSTLRSLLPHPTSKTDKSTVVGEIIKYIQSLQVKLDMLTKKRQQVMAARTLSAFHSIDTLPKAFVSNGLTLVDHSGDPMSMTAITALPPPGSESCLQSYLGSNVGLHVCGLNVFITTSSPRGQRGLLQKLLVTIHKHALDVINATISTSNASIFHCLHCQASQDAELLNNDLHSALQSVITNFEPQF